MATQRGLLFGALFIVLHCAPLPVQLANAENSWTDRWDGSIGAATDYLYRGITQSDGEPAVQGGLQAQFFNGWSAGVWSSTVDLNQDGSTGYEVDLYAARSWSLNPDWSVLLGATHREYLGDGGSLDYDHDELNASLSFQQRVTASLAWSPSTTLYSSGPVEGETFAWELAFQQPLAAHWSAFAGIGRYDLRDLVGESYTYWSVGLTFSWASLQVDAAHIGVDEAAEHIFGYGLDRSRWTGALSVRF